LAATDTVSATLNRNRKGSFQNKPENFIEKTAKETEAIQTLLQVNSELVCQKDSSRFFRERK